LAVKYYFRFLQNSVDERSLTSNAIVMVSRPLGSLYFRYLVQQIAKNDDKRNDARLAPASKPEVEILQKPHKPTRSTRLLIRLWYNIWSYLPPFDR